MNLVVVRSRGGPHGVSASTIRTRATRMLRHLGREGDELSVMLVDDATMRALNARWRGKDASTDVLSFSMAEGEYGDVNPRMLGDVVISVPTAARQAAQGGGAVMDELTTLLAHGLLHLLGHDHRTAREDRAMRRRTEELVASAVTSRR